MTYTHGSLQFYQHYFLPHWDDMMLGVKCTLQPIDMSGEPTCDLAKVLGLSRVPTVLLKNSEKSQICSSFC